MKKRTNKTQTQKGNNVWQHLIYYLKYVHLVVKVLIHGIFYIAMTWSMT